MANSNVDLMVRIMTDANTDALKKTQEAVEDLGEKSDVSSSSVRDIGRASKDTAQAADALSDAVRGNLGGALQRLTSLSTSSTDALIKLGGAAAALKVGWQLGAAIDQTLGLSDAVADLKTRTQDAVNALGVMDRTTLSALKAELDAVQQFDFAQTRKALDEITSATDQAAQNTRAMADAQRDYDVAVVRGRVAAGSISSEEGRVAEAQINAKSEIEALNLENANLRESREQEIKRRDEARIKQRDLERQQREAQAQAEELARKYEVGLTPGDIDSARTANQERLDHEMTGARLGVTGFNRDTAQAHAAARAAQIDEVNEAMLRARSLANKSGEAATVADAVEQDSGGQIQTINSRLTRNALRERTARENGRSVAVQTDRERRESEAANAARMAAEEQRKQEGEQAAAERAQAQADRQRLKALEAELKEKERALSALDKTGPLTVDQQRGEAEAAARELEQYSSLKPSQGGGSISKLRELRANADREAKEFSAAADAVVTSHTKLISQVTALRRSIETISSQMRNAEQ